MGSYIGPLEDQERLGGFSNRCLFTALTRAGQILSHPTSCGNPGGSSHIHASMVCLNSSVCRSGKSRPRSIRSWAKEVWRKVRKPKAQWLQLALSFDLCDRTPWSPNAPSPRPPFLQSAPSLCLNPDPPTGAHGDIRPNLNCPWLNRTAEPQKQDNVPYGQV